MESRAQATVWLQRFDGSAPIKPYQAQFELAALQHKWDLSESADQLSMVLEDEAMMVLERPSSERQNAEQ